MDEFKTIGEASLAASLKAPETNSPIDLQRAMQKEYVDELMKCVEDYRKVHKGDFYVVVITKQERLMHNVLRNFFLARISCPSPDYDQTLFRYNAKDENVEYIWCIPDPVTCATYKANALQIHPSERQLLKHVLDFSSGELLRYAKKMNNEKADSPLLDV
jgi:hypothetical protein